MLPRIPDNNPCNPPCCCSCCCISCSCCGVTGPTPAGWFCPTPASTPPNAPGGAPGIAGRGRGSGTGASPNGAAPVAGGNWVEILPSPVIGNSSLSASRSEPPVLPTAKSAMAFSSEVVALQGLIGRPAVDGQPQLIDRELARLRIGLRR